MCRLLVVRIDEQNSTLSHGSFTPIAQPRRGANTILSIAMLVPSSAVNGQPMLDLLGLFH